MKRESNLKQKSFNFCHVCTALTSAPPLLAVSISIWEPSSPLVADVTCGPARSSRDERCNLHPFNWLCCVGNPAVAGDSLVIRNLKDKPSKPTAFFFHVHGFVSPWLHKEHFHRQINTLNNPNIRRIKVFLGYNCLTQPSYSWA